KKRLTGPLFIKRYLQFLKTEGTIHLKTDNNFFYNYSLEEVKRNNYEILEATADLYGDKIEDYDVLTQEILNIKTHYEKIFSEKGHKIHYLKFKPNGKAPKD